MYLSQPKLRQQCTVKRVLKRNLLANYLGQGWVALMGFAFIPLYIKFLGIEAYGLIGLFTVLQAWLRLFDMGMAPTLNREMARFTGGAINVTSIRDLLRSIECVTLGVAFVTVLGLYLSSNWLASSWLNVGSLPVAVVAQALTIMGVVIALRFAEGIYRSSIIGLQKQVQYNVVNSSMATLRDLGAVAILAWLSPTIQAFFLWQGVVSVLSLVVLAVLTYVNLPCTERPARFSTRALGEVWHFARGMMGITFLVLLLTQVDKVLLSKLLSLSDYGYYTLAATVASALYVLVSPVAQAWLPRLSQLHAVDDTVELTRTYHQGAQLVTVIMGSAAMVLIFFSDTFLSLWTQDPVLVQRTSVLLSLLVFGNMLNGLMWIPYQTQLAYGWTGLTVRINFVSVLIIVPLILWVVPRYGAEGAAWVWVGLNSGYVFVGVHFMFRRILTTEKWHWYMKDIIKPLLAAGLVVILLRKIIPSSTEVFEQLVVLVIASILTLCASGLAADQVRLKALEFVKTNISLRANKP